MLRDSLTQEVHHCLIEEHSVLQVREMGGIRYNVSSGASYPFGNKL